MKRHVEEIASDARTLEERLNSLSDQFSLETIVWANGKLLIVVRESSDREPAAIQSSQDKSSSDGKRQSNGNSARRLPKAGARIRKAKLIQ